MFWGGWIPDSKMYMQDQRPNNSQTLPKWENILYQIERLIIKLDNWDSMVSVQAETNQLQDYNRDS